jgi:hypothetical protein
MARRNYSNIAVDTTLATGINGAVTTLDVVSATGWPIAPFLLVIDPGTGTEELILVGAKSGVTFSSLTRGFGGTSAVAHNAAAPIRHVLTKEDHDLVWTHIHVPGTDDTAQISHDNLSGVSADDHHPQSHSLASHTGQLDHGTGLSGLTDDDHTQYLKEKASGGIAAEVPEHTHVSTSQAGTIDHGVLTGLSDDDHPQYATNTEFDNHDSRHAPGGADQIAALPWGFKGSMQKTGGAQQITSTGIETVANMSMSVDLVAGRRYILTVIMLAQIASGASNFVAGGYFLLLDGVSISSAGVNNFKGSGGNFSVDGEHGNISDSVFLAVEFDHDTGTFEFEVSIQTLTLTGTMFIQGGYAYIEDVGPA